MTDPTPDLQVTDNPDAGRYEARKGEQVAGFAAYRLEGATITFTHTEVDPAFEGQGVGSVLVRGALDDVRARGLGVRPLCPFVRAYIKRHREYQDLLAAP